ncbi:gliding motility-associated C-terminal domain-containing protein, partial [Flavobacterium sp.]|uniref:T9SS type B sorting domain-containing protein n=1 Tax=Flavobacterium sp. TaxID=239 RepID=UPI003752BE21
TSLEGITGTWNPATISNTASGTYTFTPTSGLCALATTLNVTVLIITPTFDVVNPVCSGTTSPTLATTSNNGIVGTWNPATVSNTTSGNYTFTPNANQCATTLTINITVNPTITPVFTTISPFCQNGIPPTLPTTSNNGITGTWNPATVDNTTSGTYSFTFTPDPGFCANTTILTVVVNPNITPTFNAIAPICQNATAPTLQSTSNNGFTGTWNPAIISNTASGTYTFTPNSGQCATTTTIDVLVNPNETPTFNPLPPVCFGSVAPTLPLTSTNGISGTWNPSVVSTTNSGSYTFTPNTGVCAIAVTINVTISPNIIPTFNAIPDVCYQTTSPILPTASTNGITGTWNPATISNTASGTYTFTANPNQCATTATLSVTVTIITPIFNVIPPVCNGSSVPNLQTTSNNGITGTWNPATISNTQSATYTFTPNANQCAITTSISVTVDTIIPTFNAIADVCFGTTSPNLQTVSNNGITGTWNPTAISNTTSGTYTFTPNPNQCAVAASILVNVTTINPTFSIATSICENSIAPIVSNTSNNGITGTWNPSTISNTTSGSYTFTPDANQCATTTLINVIVNPNVTPTFNEIPPVCYQSTSPILPTISTNGIEGTWNPSVVSNTTSGAYTFTPNTGICALPISIQIIVNTIIPTFTQIAPVCFGSTAPILPTTSTNGITGTWNPAIISNTISGTYTFTPDANQCATIVTMNIDINSITPIFNSIASICENATAPTLQTTSNNGITGTWNPNIINNTATTVYTFTPDASQCATTVSITIVVNPIVTPTFTAIPDVCYNTTSPILPTTSNNGINGTWNPATISNTVSNVYTFTPNVGECAIATTLTVNVTTIVTTFDAIAPICENATAPILPTTSTNGITGTWFPALVSNTSTGSYTFTPDANQCATTASLSVTVNPNVTPLFDAIPIICYNATAPILPSVSNNGITGTWNPSIVSSTTAATYTFTPNAGICATTATLTTTINTIVPNFNPIADVCFGSTAPTLPTTSTNGITGTWNPATVSNTTAGSYEFTPDANQCAIVTTLQININVINPTFTAVADVCFGSVAPTLPTTSTNGITGTWNPATVSNTTPTLYTFTPDANQCATTSTLQININSITPTFATVNPICEGSTAPILPTTSQNNITGTWNALVNNTATATYTFTPDANQCATTVSLTVVVNTKIVPLFTFGTSGTGCQGASAQVLITQISTNGINGTWSPNTLDYSILGTTIYTFTPNAGECAVGTTYSLSINPNITPTFNAIAPLCSGSASPILPLTSLNGYTGTWNPAIVSTTASATYTFTPTSGQCATTTTLSVTINPSPTDLAIIVSNVLNQTAQGVIEITSVTSGVAPFQYNINNGSFSNTSSYANLLPGDYIITVKDANGCEYEETVTVETTCIFPNGISPNGDGKNDTFNLNGCNVKFISFFNRYGMKINSFSNYTSQWDGTTSDAKNLPDGTYFYSAELTDGNVKTGWVYIAR